MRIRTSNGFSEEADSSGKSTICENWLSLTLSQRKLGFHFDCYLLNIDHGQEVKDPQVLFYLIIK